MSQDRNVRHVRVEFHSYVHGRDSFVDVSESVEDADCFEVMLEGGVRFSLPIGAYHALINAVSRFMFSPPQAPTPPE